LNHFTNKYGWKNIWQKQQIADEKHIEDAPASDICMIAPNGGD
jgi:hypothetical protein